MKKVIYYLNSIKSRYFMLIACFSLLMGIISCSSDDFEGYGPDENVPGIESQGWVRTIKSVDGTLPGTRGVAVTNKLWNPGDTIRIKFLGGGSAIQDTVKKYAAFWLPYVNLEFKYVLPNDTADVKIDFNSNTAKRLAWSTIGTDCRLVAQTIASANFVGLDVLPSNIVRGEVLRTFGHILGLGFEHQHPNSPMQFNSNAVSELSKTYGLTQAEAQDIIVLYSTAQSNYAVFDKNSIMTINIPANALVGGFWAPTTSFNTNLSATDIAFVSGLYPFPSMPGVLINGVQWARCNVDAPGRFAATPESSGMMYQWNRRTAWPATGTLTGWVYSIPTGNSWEPANDPSPAGWRVPDTTDFNTLLDTVHVTQAYIVQNNVNGLQFTDIASGNSIFLPFVGIRYPYADLYQPGIWGGYWSGTPDSGMPSSYKDACSLGCTNAGAYMGVSSRWNSLSIRCVRDE